MFTKLLAYIEGNTLYYVMLLALLVLLYLGISAILPKKKYRSWSAIQRDHEEKKVRDELEEYEKRKDRFAFLKYASANRFENEAARIGWNVGTKAPMIVYGCMLTGVGIGLFMESPFAMICGLIGGAWAPWFYLNKRSQEYISLLEEQVEILIQAVSSGYAITRNITDAMQRATNSLEEPLKSKWQKLMAEYYSGRSLSVLLDELENEIPVKEFKVFSSVIRVVEKSGGDATQTMKDVAAVIQNKRLMKEELKAEMAQQRQAHRFNVLIGIAIVLFFRFVLADNYSQLMDTLYGQLLVSAMFVYFLWSFYRVDQLTKIPE
jgi:tight adherence protein B